MDTFAISWKEKFSKLIKKDTATVIGLYGDLGAGKTAFVKALAKAFGINEHITSPTFVIMKRFEIQNVFKNLIHIDAYRLESGKELLKLGWQELISNPQNLILIEWPEKVVDVMPADHMVMRFTFIDEKTREVTLLF